MPNRIIKESIWCSPSINQLSPLAERHFYRLLPLPDDHGCFQSTASVVNGRLYPLLRKVTDRQIRGWHTELEKADICRFWKGDDGREYGVFINWEEHQRVRSLHKRKTPPPPAGLLTVDGNCRQLPSDDGLNPNPNPNHNPLPPIPPKGGAGGFEDFWKAYPKKVGKDAARRAWAKIPKPAATLKDILTALGWQVTSEQWTKDGGRYVPNPATYLNQGRWQDEPPTPLKRTGPDTSWTKQ